MKDLKLNPNHVLGAGVKNLANGLSWHYFEVKNESVEAMRACGAEVIGESEDGYTQMKMLVPWGMIYHKPTVWFLRSDPFDGSPTAVGVEDLDLQVPAAEGLVGASTCTCGGDNYCSDCKGFGYFHFSDKGG